MNILITGSNGTVGTALRSGLKGYEIFGFDLPDLDVTKREHVVDALKGMDAVVHLAWNIPVHNFDTGGIDPMDMLGALHIYQVAVEAGVKRVIIASSVHAMKFTDNMANPGKLIKPFDLPIPDSPYGASKCFTEALGRHFAESTGLEVVCIRLGGVNRVSDAPPEGPKSERQVWLSQRDCVSLVDACLQAKSIPLGYTIVNAVSLNKDRLHDIENPFGWKPVDGAA